MQKSSDAAQQFDDLSEAYRYQMKWKITVPTFNPVPLNFCLFFYMQNMWFKKKLSILNSKINSSLFFCKTLKYMAAS